MQSAMAPELAGEPTCLVVMAEYMCAVAFPRCDPDPLEASKYYEIPACWDYCTNSVFGCTGEMATAMDVCNRSVYAGGGGGARQARRKVRERGGRVGVDHRRDDDRRARAPVDSLARYPYCTILSRAKLLSTRATRQPSRRTTRFARSRGRRRPCIYPVTARKPPCRFLHSVSCRKYNSHSLSLRRRCSTCRCRPSSRPCKTSPACFRRNLALRTPKHNL